MNWEIIGSNVLFPTLLLLFCCVLVDVSFLRTSSIARDPLNFGKIPLLITKRANAPRLEPPLNAVQMEHVPTHTKGDWQTIFVIWGGICLVFDGRLVEAISANCARVSTNVPTPHCHCIPLPNFKLGGSLRFRLNLGLGFALGWLCGGCLREEWNEIKQKVRC